MGRSIPTLREYLKSEFDSWIKMGKVLPNGKKRALKELLNTAISMSDAGSLVSNPVPSETMFMLMLIHLKAKLNDLEERIERDI